MTKKELNLIWKFLSTHRRSCTIHVYSSDERHCSCGRDAAAKVFGYLLRKEEESDKNESRVRKHAPHRS